MQWGSSFEQFTFWNEFSIDIWLLLPSGGISIKPSANMDAMRADMGGAATISSAIVTAVKLNLPLNMIGK